MSFYKLRVLEITPEPNVSVVELDNEEFDKFLKRMKEGILFYNDEMKSFFTADTYFWTRLKK